MKKKSVKKTTNVIEATTTTSLRRVDAKKAKEYSPGKDSIGSKRSSIDSVVNPKKPKQSKASELVLNTVQKIKKSKFTKLSNHINSSTSLSPNPPETITTPSATKKIVYEQ